jgi:TonB-dependent starch-binding outer membrane protein SusC
LFAGINPGIVNAGSIQNSGVDMDLGLRGRQGAISYNVNLNASYIENEVLNIGDDVIPLQGLTLRQSRQPVTRYEVGLPVWYFYGLQTDGIFQSDDEVSNYTDESGRRNSAACQRRRCKICGSEWTMAESMMLIW